MQHQYWVTKKSVLRKLGGKEDECIVSSDAELDAKLELFRSISDSCIQLQRVINLYQERLCYLAQEENALGRYLKECGRGEKNSSAARILETSGKALAYTGRQRLNIRPPLVRLHHEVETFRGRAVSDTRATVAEMEKVRTEYRAALSWMKSASAELDPDTGLGLDRFRKAQSYVRTSKVHFDRLMLACLQKVDLLAAARCNMFSHALVAYQKALGLFAAEAGRTLNAAAGKIGGGAMEEGGDLAASLEGSGDKDRKTFFDAEYTDKAPVEDAEEKNLKNDSEEDDSSHIANLLNEDFNQSWTNQVQEPPSDVNSGSELAGLSWPTNADLLTGEFMPSKLLQEGLNFLELDLSTQTDNKEKSKSPTSKPNEKPPSKDSNSAASQVSWLSLFAELDPLANQTVLQSAAGDRA